MRKRLVFLLIATSLTFQGCAGGIVLGTLGAIGGGATAVIKDRRHADVQQLDSKICAKISDAIAEDRTLSTQTHVVPTCYNKVVLLTGEAPSQGLRARAIETAKLTSVRRIHNEIRLRQPLSPQAQEADRVLNAKVRTIITTKHFNSASYTQLTVNDGVVFLTGMLTRDEAAQLENTIRYIDGVKRVVSLIEYVRLVS
jgi:osmotically-inducible protein OsmY